MARHPLISLQDIKEDFKYLFNETYIITVTGALYFKRGDKWKRRCTWINNNGYECVEHNENGKRKHFLVHRLVAEAFIPNPEGLPVINHKDENKLNNRVENLEWCTYSYNNSYGTKIEKFKKTFKALCDANGGPRQQEVICLETGEVFKGAKWAALHFGITHGSMIRACLYGGTVKKEYHFKYTKDLPKEE